MARAMVDVQRVNSAGVTNPTYTVFPVDGVEFVNTGTEIIIINAPTAATVTFITDATIDGLTIEDKTVSLGIGDEYMISGLSKQYFNTPDGTVMVDSTQTDTEIAVIKN